MDTTSRPKFYSAHIREGKMDQDNGAFYRYRTLISATVQRSGSLSGKPESECSSPRVQGILCGILIPRGLCRFFSRMALCHPGCGLCSHDTIWYSCVSIMVLDPGPALRKDRIPDTPDTAPDWQSGDPVFRFHRKRCPRPRKKRHFEGIFKNRAK